MHALHVRYATSIRLDTLDDVFALIEDLDPKNRDQMLMNTFITVIGVKMPTVPSPDEKIGDQIQNCINYPTFKRECHGILARTSLSQHFLAQAIVNDVLSYLYVMGDESRLEDVKNNHRQGIARLQATMENETDEQRIAMLLDLVKKHARSIEELPDRMREHKLLYNCFCDRVAGPLLSRQSKGHR